MTPWLNDPLYHLLSPRLLLHHLGWVTPLLHHLGPHSSLLHYSLGDNCAPLHHTGGHYLAAAVNNSLLDHLALLVDHHLATWTDLPYNCALGSCLHNLLTLRCGLNNLLTLGSCLNYMLSLRSCLYYLLSLWCCLYYLWTLSRNLDNLLALRVNLDYLLSLAVNLHNVLSLAVNLDHLALTVNLLHNASSLHHLSGRVHQLTLAVQVNPMHNLSLLVDQLLLWLHHPTLLN